MEGTSLVTTLGPMLAKSDGDKLVDKVGDKLDSMLGDADGSSLGSMLGVMLTLGLELGRRLTPLYDGMLLVDGKFVGARLG